ncbi:MAG: ABC transporter permease [Colwellia sp.]|nr:ABC transporter permease [Colwellia sp.]
MNLFSYQLKQASLSLRKNPGFVFSVVTTMGITLGALLCVFTLAYVMLIKPLPYPEQAKIYQVEQRQIKENGEIDNKYYTYPGLLHFYKNQTDFSEGSLIYAYEDVLTNTSDQQRLITGYVTPEWFTLLDIPMILGRRFAEGEALDSNHPVAVLSYQTWQNLFNGEANVLDQHVEFNGVTFSVVGVTAEHFIEPDIYHRGDKTHVWLPWDFNRFASNQEAWGRIIPTGFLGKLTSKQSINQIEQRITPAENEIWRDNVADISFLKGWTLEMKLHPLQSVILGDSRNVIYLMLAGVLGLVLIASANITNLFMSRVAQQQHKLAICAAIGAKRKHLMMTFLAESIVLMVMTLIVAVTVASLGFTVLETSLAETLPRIDELNFNRVSLLAVLFCLVSFSAFFTYISIRVVPYKKLSSSLQQSGKGNNAQISKRVRQGLVVSQVAIATILLFLNGNIFKQAMGELYQDVGFNTEQIFSLRTAYSGADRPERKFFRETMATIVDELALQPEVDLISHSNSPLGRFGQWPINDEVRQERYTAFIKSVDQKYFQLIEQKTISGRVFTQADIKDRTNFWIVNEALANYLAPNGDAVGINVTTSPEDTYKIVGVVGNIKQPNQEGTPFRVYMPGSNSGSRLLIKFKDNQTIPVTRLTELLQKSSQSMVVYDYQSLSSVQNQAHFSQRTAAISTAILALITLGLAVIGIYGILSYSSQTRRFEIGTRMAIGAKGKDIVLMVMKDNVAALFSGVLVSLLLLLSLYLMFTQKFNYYLDIKSVWLFIGTSLLISMLSMVACYLPLRQYIDKPVIHSLKGSE